MTVTTAPTPRQTLTEEEFLEICRNNPEMKIEQSAQGEVLIMPPTGGETGSRNSEFNRLLGNWAVQDGTGVVFDSSTLFVLPNGAKRGPDAAWVRRSRLANLTPEQKRKFLPLCPDFVVELKSPSDSLTDLDAKMQEYIANGAQLGWLIDPDARRIAVYRPGRSVENVIDAEAVSGENLLPGFVLDLTRMWQSGL